MATRTLLIILISSFFIVACVPPEPVVRTDQYHDKTEPKTSNVLNGLQLKAIQLMNQLKFDQSILYLQRAIKVAPRDPLNWHYLGQNYWHLKDFASCRSMVQRAISYSQFNPDLSNANETLLKQCGG